MGVSLEDLVDPTSLLNTSWDTSFDQIGCPTLRGKGENVPNCARLWATKPGKMGINGKIFTLPFKQKQTTYPSIMSEAFMTAIWIEIFFIIW